MMQSTARQTLRFRDFELDVEAYQLRRQGKPIKLERQPMELLILLIERRGRMVSRGDIAERLWGKDVFVDVETGVNIAIRKIRQALRDSAEKPAFVERVVGKGYRFVAPVEAVPAATDAGVTRSKLKPLRNSGSTKLRWRVFGWLEKAYRAHDVHLAFLPVDPRWAAYRADPRFDDLVARCGFRRETTQ